MPNYEGLVVTGEKTAVVFDFGCAYTKCGFAGENGPRFILPSDIRHPKTKEVVRISSISDESELYEVLVEFVHFIFFRQLLVNPKDRRIVIVESMLSTSKFRNTVTKVLFKQFEVLSVGFVTSHVVALLTLGIPSGLVFDCGYTETLVLPVYEGIPLMSCCRTFPTGSKSIHQYLEALLKETSTVKIGKNTDVPLSSVEGLLKESVLEDIKVRACFVTRISRVKQMQEAMLPDSTVEMPAPPHGFEYPLDGNKLLHIDGSLREKACELLFERNQEETSVAVLLLNSLAKCPIDTRRTLAENIVILGGTAMLPGFRHRLIMELQELITTPKYADVLGVKTFKLHSPPAKENYVAWLGGAIFGALEILASRSLSREQFLQGATIPDWCVLNDSETVSDKNVGS